MVERVTQADFARMMLVSRKTITKWKSHLLVMEGELVDVEASKARIARYRVGGIPKAARGQAGTSPAQAVSQDLGISITRAEAAERLEALDGTVAFDWTPTAVEQRLYKSAAAVGLTLARSDLAPPVHWGGWQVQRLDGIGGHDLAVHDVVGGYGYELEASEVLYCCRRELVGYELLDLCPADAFSLSIEQLKVLAFPFCESHDQSPPDWAVLRNGI